MKIIHTSDWHLGKTLEGHSRLDEQVKFCKDFINIVKEENIDLVIIAGDVFDTSNPPASAESLFYDTITEISENGKRCVFVIAGNHDNPDRLEAISPLAYKNGIIIMGYPDTSVDKCEFDGFKVLESENGFTKLKFGEEVVNIASLPYPSEKRLNEVISGYEDVELMQVSYSEKIGQIFRKMEEKFSEDEINIAVSHIFVVGSEITDSERRIELGGTLLVNKSDLPKTSQYTALGHIHKPQTVSKNFNAYYSGSPIQYSKTERNTSKSVRLIELEAGKDAEVSEIYLKNYKQIHLFKCSNIEEALKICEEKSGEDIFAYFEIQTEDVISLEDIRQMKKMLKNILEIKPIVKSVEFETDEKIIDINKRNITEFFIDFYKQENDGLTPIEGVVNLFNDLISKSEVSEDEAN